MSQIPFGGPATLVEALRRAASREPSSVAYRFLTEGEGGATEITYARLDEEARTIAAWLQEIGGPGERAVLLHPPGLEFVAAFFGCLYAGWAAVPGYPPRPGRDDARIAQILSDARPKVILTTSALASSLEAWLGRSEALRDSICMGSDGFPRGLAEEWRETGVREDALAVLQYTSGSTSAPRGVMVSHGNLARNCASIEAALRHGADSVAVSWLPHFHDMGLVYGIAVPAYLSFPCVLMAPAAFLQRPIRWLRAITRYRATHSGGPNFAYEICLRKTEPDDRADLDLSSWKVAYNGAEPVRRQTLEDFARAFEPHGLRRSALCPAYGLAEATLKVTVTPPGRGPLYCVVDAAELESNRVVKAPDERAGAKSVVGCGPATPDTEVVIVDPATRRRRKPGEVGEIWVASPSVAAGYFGRPDATREVFGTRIEGSEEGPYLRTGDLGFLDDGELYVTGRTKDLIILHGLNHYPQDIELTVERCHRSLRPGAGVAFSVEREEGERLVIVHEVERTQRNADLGGVIEAVRCAVADEHEIQPYAIVLVPPGTVPKTSSGKVQRQACRARFLAGEVTPLVEWRAVTAEAGRSARSGHADATVRAPMRKGSRASIEEWLVSKLSAHSGVAREEVDLRRPFAYFGLDSARALTLLGELERWLGRHVSPTVLWNYPTIESLARALAESPGDSDSPSWRGSPGPG